MELTDVIMPSKDGFNLYSYQPLYEGIIIALDIKNNPIGYIIYNCYDQERLLIFGHYNSINEETDVYDTLEELLEENIDIHSLKLIKFK